MSAEYKNKIFLMTAIAICFIGISGLSLFWLNEYRQASYEDISKFCQIMILTYPETETSILSSLKEYHTTIDTEQYDSDFLAKYGYEKKDFDNEISKKFVIFTLMVFMSISAGIFFCTHSLSRRHKTRIAELTSHDHRFKRWFENSPIRAVILAHLEGGIVSQMLAPLKEVKNEYLPSWFLLTVRQCIS